MFKDLKVGRKLQVGFGIVIGFNIIAALVTIMGFNRMFNQKEGLIPRSLLRNKLFQDMEEVIY